MNPIIIDYKTIKYELSNHKDVIITKCKEMLTSKIPCLYKSYISQTYTNFYKELKDNRHWEEIFNVLIFKKHKKISYTEFEGKVKISIGENLGEFFQGI
jgi:hypothetical protein